MSVAVEPVRRSMMKAISLPHEHGGYLTIAGATVAGMALAPLRLPALGVGLVLAAAFFARGPLEARRPARFDRLALVGYALVAVAGAALSTHPWSLLLGGAAVAASLLVRAGRRHRHVLFELMAMTAVGAAVGPVAFAGGTAWHTTIVATLILAVHAGVAVPLVRTELRPRERGLAGRADLFSLACLALAAATVALIGPAAATLCFLPRLLHLGARMAGLATGRRPALVGLRETLALALVVTLLVVTLR